VGFADALVGDPRILILDEPTIGLDPNQIRLVRDLIRELGQERTVILSSHILPEVEAVCTRVQIMHKGRLIGQGKPSELRHKITDGGVSVTAEFKGTQAKGNLTTSIESLQSIDGVRSVRIQEDAESSTTKATIQTTRGVATREAIFELAVQNGDKLIGLAEESASLEDIFVEITMREDDIDGESGGTQ